APGADAQPHGGRRGRDSRRADPLHVSGHRRVLLRSVCAGAEELRDGRRLTEIINLPRPEGSISMMCLRRHIMEIDTTNLSGSTMKTRPKQNQPCSCCIRLVAWEHE